MKAWHFLQDNGRLQWRCGRYSKPKVGQTLTVNPDKIRLCHFGLHASIKILDALEYAPGSMICRVELGGKIIKDVDKVVASERMIIQMTDVTEVLHEFACWCAERALNRITNPDQQVVAAIETKRKWLRGEITDEELLAACSAARSVAYSVARSETTPERQLQERSAQNRKLTRMVNQLFKECE